jgi:hypothetical protein
MARNRVTFFEEGMDRPAPTVWNAISAWVIIGLLLFVNIVGFVLDKAATP